MPTAAKILIVDDDLEIRQLLGEQLRDLGHDSIYAADGIQALSLVRRERPDLMLLDLLLPAGDGFCVLERLRNIRRSLTSRSLSSAAHGRPRPRSVP
jgi:CheY-like chemotaxis protein